MSLADHMQRLVRPNFAVSWDEVGEENQVEETFTLSSMKDITGKQFRNSRYTLMLNLQML